jgi:cysteine-rich repeat protein
MLGAALSSQCDPSGAKGTAQVAFRLQLPDGAPLTCEEAGVGTISFSLFLHWEDAVVTAQASALCEVGSDGRGVARVSLPVGFYETAFVSMRTPEGGQAMQAGGAQAAWQYVAVEISEGGLTEFVPGVVGTFRGVAVCGNGRVEEGEECDDGNTIIGDGCSDTCQWESTEDRTLHIQWTPTQGGEEVTCAALSASTVDIVVYESGTATPVVMVGNLSCTDRSYSFSNIEFGSYDLVLTGLTGGVVEVADGSALGVNHAAPGPTTAQVELEGR